MAGYIEDSLGCFNEDSLGRMKRFTWLDITKVP